MRRFLAIIFIRFFEFFRIFRIFKLSRLARLIRWRVLRIVVFVLLAFGALPALYASSLPLSLHPYSENDTESQPQYAQNSKRDAIILELLHENEIAIQLVVNENHDDYSQTDYDHSDESPYENDDDDGTTDQEDDENNEEKESGSQEEDEEENQRTPNPQTSDNYSFVGLILSSIGLFVSLIALWWAILLKKGVKFYL